MLRTLVFLKKKKRQKNPLTNAVSNFSFLNKTNWKTIRKYLQDHNEQ